MWWAFFGPFDSEQEAIDFVEVHKNVAREWIQQSGIRC